MTYLQNSLIEAVDFNTLAGGNPTTTSGTLNAVWATGGGDKGYGQTAIANVTVGNTVTASNWASLINTTANIATHQGTSISSVSAPTVGSTVTYLAAVTNNLTTVFNSRLNAATQGSTVSNTVTYNTGWSSAITFTHTVSFANGDAARYFFNSGGQLAITCNHPSGSGINSLFNNLAIDTGTVVMSAPTTGSITIAGIPYNGVTKIGGFPGGGATIASSSGYYSLSSANANIFTQVANTGPIGYLSTYIRIIAKSNGTQGSNGDTGSIITLYTIWDEIPNGLTVSPGSSTTLTVRPPETVNLANTWGSISLSGTVSGS